MGGYQHQTFEMDLRFQLPAHFIYVGGTNSGKTTLFLNTLKNIEACYFPKPEKILFMYQEYQTSYLTAQTDLAKKGVKFECVKAVDMSLEDIVAANDDVKGHMMVVYDDCTESSSTSSKVADMTMRGRHKNVSVVLLWHTLFPKGPQARLISLNATYFLLLTSLRIRSQVKCLAAQIGIKHLPAAYEDAMKRGNYASVLVDLHNKTPDFARIRSNILPNQKPHYVYVPPV